MSTGRVSAADPSSAQKLLALVALSATGTTVGVFSKLSQVSGRYNYSPASAVVSTEFFKLVVSLVIIVKLLLKGELVSEKEIEEVRRRKRAVTAEHDGHSDVACNSAAAELPEASSGTTTSRLVPDTNTNNTSVGRSSQSPRWLEQLQVLIEINVTRRVVLHEIGLAACYTIVNLVTYAIFIHASGSIFFLLKASSPVVTALLLFSVVGRTISKPQWIAVIMQCAGLVATQIDTCNSMAAASHVGYALILINVVVSCLAGVWNEHIIKNYGTSVNVQNTILYLSGVLINLALFFFASPRLVGSSSSERLGFFEGYNASVCAVIAANGSIGLVITAVYKYADVVVKTFGLAGSTMFLYLLEMAHVIPAGREMPFFTTISGAAVVFYASFVYISPGAAFAPDAGTVPGDASPPPAFDVMSLTWRSVIWTTRVRRLIYIGAAVVISIISSRVLCTQRQLLGQ